MFDWKRTDEELPINRKYVIVKHNRTNLIDSDDQDGVQYMVVKFVRGLSISERNKLPDSDHRKSTWRSEDEGMGNNKKPYCWMEFGPDELFGQEVIKWSYIKD